jgi:hypothetical protein
MTKYLSAGSTKNLVQLHKAADLSLIPKKQINGYCYLRRNAGTTLTTYAKSKIVLLNGARKEDVYCRLDHVVTQVL